MNADEVMKFLGSKTRKDMEQTRWYAFARIIEHCLYYGGIERKTRDVFGLPDNVVLPGVEGNKVDLARVMRELQHECDRMALLEATS
jgi:hypothetical protein